MYALHDMAFLEKQGQDNIAARVTALLESGYDPHRTNGEGATVFNLAALHDAQVTGRLVTLHWLEQALAGKGGKGLNDTSGSHGSTLAQYMAKWLDDAEFPVLLRRAMDKGMVIDTPNDSGWTPLIAASAMGRLEIVRVLVALYTRDALCRQTTTPYQADYHGVAVTYKKGLNAVEVAQERLFQDEDISDDLGQSLWLCMEEIAQAIAAK